MSYQFNPNATSNMPGDIVQVKIPDDDDYVMCVGTDGVPFVSKKSNIGSRTSLFEQLRYDPDCIQIHYPQAGGILRLHNDVNGYFFDTPTDVLYRSESGVRLFETNSNGTLVYNQSGTVHRGNDGTWNAALMVIFYVQDSNDISDSTFAVQVPFCYNINPAISLSLSYSGIGSFGAGAVIVAKFAGTQKIATASVAEMQAEILTGWNIVCFNIEEDGGVYYERLYINGTQIINSNTTVATTTSRVSSVSATNLPSDNRYALAKSPLAMSAVFNRAVLVSEQLDILDQFKTDHGIA